MWHKTDATFRFHLNVPQLRPASPVVKSLLKKLALRCMPLTPLSEVAVTYGMRANKCVLFKRAVALATARINGMAMVALQASWTGHPQDTLRLAAL
jgi:hypothetical protein